MSPKHEWRTHSGYGWTLNGAEVDNSEYFSKIWKKNLLLKNVIKVDFWKPVGHVEKRFGVLLLTRSENWLNVIFEVHEDQEWCDYDLLRHVPKVFFIFRFVSIFRGPLTTNPNMNGSSQSTIILCA